MTQAKEVKIGAGYAGQAPTGKEYSFAELEGLKMVFSRLEKSNPKRSAKVDYWLSKNNTILSSAWQGYMEREWALLRNYANMEVIDGVEYLVHIGKDETDLMYFAQGGMFKKVDEKLKETFNPFWEQSVEPTEENPQPAPIKKAYVIKFKTETSEIEFNDALVELRKEYKTSADLWKLDEQYLENLNVVWQDVKQGNDGKPFVESDATAFRSLLYDNAIKF